MVGPLISYISADFAVCFGKFRAGKSEKPVLAILARFLTSNWCCATLPRRSIQSDSKIGYLSDSRKQKKILSLDQSRLATAVVTLASLMVCVRRHILS